MQQALAAGFTDCEVYYAKNRHFGVTILEGEVSDYKNSDLQGVCFRGTYAGRTGYAYTERLYTDDIAALVAQAKENAALLPTEEREILYHTQETYPTLSTLSTCGDCLEYLTPEEKIQAAKRMECAALQEKRCITSIDHCTLSTDFSEIAIANSYGLSLSFAKQFITAYVCAIAKNGTEVKTGAHFWKGNQWEAFDPITIGQTAAKRAASYLGAKTIPAGRYAVVLDGSVMAALLGVYANIFFAERVQQGFSLLGEKKQIAAPCVTLCDLPLLPNGYASTPFDSEGVACYNKTIIDKGILQTLLYNCKSAAKDGVSSTGNGFKAQLMAPIQTDITNLHLSAGTRTQAQLLQDLAEGVYITEVSGLHAGANTISGDFSLSAEGFYIQNGKKAFPVEQITIAGNFYTLLQTITEVANDTYITPRGIGAPSVRIESMDIAGS